MYFPIGNRHKGSNKTYFKAFALHATRLKRRLKRVGFIFTGLKMG
jgi:hypothetical protein